MKKMICVWLAVLAAIPMLAGEAAWLTDYETAKKQAKAESKKLVMEFTGSDWCPPCIQWEKDAFSKPEFAEYAKKNLVLLKLDFPERKKLSKEQTKHNEALQEKYKIEGYPTLVVLNSEGKKLGEINFTPGGPAALIKALEKLQ